MSPAALIRLARPRDWVKNAFVAAPLFFTPEALSASTTGAVAVAVAAFCLAASATYALNDWSDREADRAHPEKRLRPVAAGEVSAGGALAFAACLAAAAAGLASLLPLPFAAFAFAYMVLNVVYSLALKQVAILDVLALAAGFVLRVHAGAAAVGVSPTVWITVCTFLLALFLALAKRRDDVVRMLAATHRPSLAGYNLTFIDAGLAMVLGALLVSYLIYTTDSAVIHRLGTDKLYLTAPFVAAGVLRYLQITLVEKRSGSPTDIALADRFLILAVLGWLATFFWLIYL
ncbi:MAG: UbiA prenyltransferase family protein [Pseudomonadota bacterium]